VGLEGKGFDNLKTKRDAYFDRAEGAMREKSVEKTNSPSHPAAIARKCDPGNEHKVDRPKYRYVMLTACGW
jgi:hypothetical protein